MNGNLIFLKGGIEPMYYIDIGTKTPLTLDAIPRPRHFGQVGRMGYKFCKAGRIVALLNPLQRAQMLSRWAARGNCAIPFLLDGQGGRRAAGSNRTPRIIAGYNLIRSRRTYRTSRQLKRIRPARLGEHRYRTWSRMQRGEEGNVSAES